MLAHPEFWAPLPSSKEQFVSEIEYIGRQYEHFNSKLPDRLKMSPKRFKASWSLWDEDGLNVLFELRRNIIRLRTIWANYTF